MTRIGVLALQGAVSEHVAVLERLGASTVEVRRSSHLAGLDGVVLPGGESTTMSMLLSSAELFDPLDGLLSEGLPVLGTCAGMILLATDVLDGRPDQRSFGRIDLAVRRNGFGRQVASFEADLDAPELGDTPLHAVFIRAPMVERAGDEVSVLASVDGPDGRSHPVLCRESSVLVAAFHPELTDDDRVHRAFLEIVEG